MYSAFWSNKTAFWFHLLLCSLQSSNVKTVLSARRSRRTYPIFLQSVGTSIVIRFYLCFCFQLSRSAFHQNMHVSHRVMREVKRKWKCSRFLQPYDLLKIIYYFLPCTKEVLSRKITKVLGKLTRSVLFLPEWSNFPQNPLKKAWNNGCSWWVPRIFVLSHKL